MADTKETMEQVVQRIAKQNHLVSFVPESDGWGGEDVPYAEAEAAIRQGIAWARERDAQIAGEWARGSLELAKIAQQCGCPDDARLHRLDSHVAIAIAGAIREEASRG